MLDYIHISYPDITELTVEVADIAWMEYRYDTNKAFIQDVL